MTTPEFIEFVEANNFRVTISQMACVDRARPAVTRYYSVWVVAGGDLNCSGSEGESLAQVAERWVETILSLRAEGLL